MKNIINSKGQEQIYQCRGVGVTKCLPKAAALAVADLDSFPLEPVTSVQKSAVSVSSISNDASRHLNLAHGALQPINFYGSVGTCITLL